VSASGDGPAGAGGTPEARLVSALAVVITVGTGATDVASFVRLGNVFASVMTGNLVLLGLAAERLSGDLAVHTVVAFAGYVLGVAIGARLAGQAAETGGRWHGRVMTALLVELALLASFTMGWELTGAAPRGASQLGLLGAAAAAMGTQSVAAQHLGGPAGGQVSTTYLTGALTNAVAALVIPGQRARVRSRELSLLAALAVGAAGGGLVLAAAADWLPAIPLAALVAAMSGVGIMRRRHRGRNRRRCE
jgi:uncharacterized membrane protein YoaK (UPF0700 family)